MQLSTGQTTKPNTSPGPHAKVVFDGTRILLNLANSTGQPASHPVSQWRRGNAKTRPVGGRSWELRAGWWGCVPFCFVTQQMQWPIDCQQPRGGCRVIVVCALNLANVIGKRKQIYRIVLLYQLKQFQIGHVSGCRTTCRMHNLRQQTNSPQQFSSCANLSKDFKQNFPRISLFTFKIEQDQFLTVSLRQKLTSIYRSRDVVLA